MNGHPDAVALREIGRRLRTVGSYPTAASRQLMMDGVELGEIADRLDEAARPRSRREIEGQRPRTLIARLWRLLRRRSSAGIESGPADVTVGEARPASGGCPRRALPDGQSVARRPRDGRETSYAGAAPPAGGAR